MQIFVNGGGIGSASSQATTKEDRIHDASATNINVVSGAYVEITGASAPVASTIVQIQVSSTIGEPLSIRKGADAAAAAAGSDLFNVNQGGGPFIVGVNLVSGDHLWVRSLSATAVTTGYLTLNLQG